jgi:hypothetical protein
MASSHTSVSLPLSTRVKRVIESIDLDEEPMAVSNTAKLLAEVQQWEKRGESLEGRVSAIERSTTSPRSDVAPGSLADWAYRVLQQEGRAMPYREIAAVIKSQGFRHARKPKNADKQLAESVWTAMYEDPRFSKVGRGIFDLFERL